MMKSLSALRRFPENMFNCRHNIMLYTSLVRTGVVMRGGMPTGETASQLTGSRVNQSVNAPIMRRRAWASASDIAAVATVESEKAKDNCIADEAAKRSITGGGTTSTGNCEKANTQGSSSTQGDMILFTAGSSFAVASTVTKKWMSTLSSFVASSATPAGLKQGLYSCNPVNAKISPCITTAWTKAECGTSTGERCYSATDASTADCDACQTVWGNYGAPNGGSYVSGCHLKVYGDTTDRNSWDNNKGSYANADGAAEYAKCVPGISYRRAAAMFARTVTALMEPSGLYKNVEGLPYQGPAGRVFQPYCEISDGLVGAIRYAPWDFVKALSFNGFHFMMVRVLPNQFFGVLGRYCVMLLIAVLSHSWDLEQGSVRTRKDSGRLCLSFFYGQAAKCRWIYPAVADSYYGVTPGIGAAPHRERSTLKVYDDLFDHPNPFPATFGGGNLDEAPAYFAKGFAKDASIQDSIVYSAYSVTTALGLMQDGKATKYMDALSTTDELLAVFNSNFVKDMLYSVNLYQLGYVLTTKSKTRLLSFLSGFKRFTTLNEVCLMHMMTPSKAMLARWNQRCAMDNCLPSNKREVKLATTVDGQDLGRINGPADQIV